MAKKSILSQLSSENIKYLVSLLKMKELMYNICEDQEHKDRLKQENEELENHVKISMSFHMQVFKNIDFNK